VCPPSALAYRFPFRTAQPGIASRREAEGRCEHPREVRLVVMTAPAKRSLLYVHVRKTGGTSLGRVLSNRFAEHDCLRMAHGPTHAGRALDGFRYVSGHVDFSFLARFRHPPFVVTCLREPIERALSVYSYYRSFPLEHYPLLLADLGQDAYRRRVLAMQLAREHSIDEIIARAPEVAREHLGNVQTRVLSGLPPESSDERLDRALAALDRCDFVGLTERLDQAAQWLICRLGWRELGPLPRENVSRARLRRDDLRPKTLDALRELTALDTELYRHATDRYERTTAEWARAADPTDPSADIADAPITSDVPFEEAISGGGWLGRERVGEEPWFSWIGATRCAWIDLRVAEGSELLVVEIAHVIEASVLEGLRLSVNGRRVSHEVRHIDGYFSVSSLVPSHVLAIGGSIARVEIAVERMARPCDLDPASPDQRELSVAVRRVALLPSRRSAMAGLGSARIR